MLAPTLPIRLKSLHADSSWRNTTLNEVMGNSAAAAKSLQSCPTLCDPIDSSPPGSAIPGILQARTLEWVAISFSNAWKWSHSVVSDSSRPHGLQPTRLFRPWNFSGKSTGVGNSRISQILLLCRSEKVFRMVNPEKKEAILKGHTFSLLI